MEYRVKLAQFDGPLDLLLHLIEEAELDICDVFVSQITSQYLSYMSDLKDVDMNRASEFLTMAATLVNIKSRSLLPKPTINDDDGEENIEETLIMQLREYKAFKLASENLEYMRKNAMGTYARLPEEFPLPPREVNFPDASVDALYIAFMDILSRERYNSEPKGRLHEIMADRFTVRSQLNIIRHRLSLNKKLAFEQLFEDEPSKLECIVTFMALLDMIMRGEIDLKQNAPYGKITVYAKELRDDDSDFEYMDEVEYDS